MTSERFKEQWSLKSVLGSFDKNFGDFVLKGFFRITGPSIDVPLVTIKDDMSLVSAENTKSQNIEAIAQKMYDYEWLRQRYSELPHGYQGMPKGVHLRRMRNKYILEVLKSLDTYIPSWKESLGSSETVRVKIQSAEDEQHAREVGLGGEQIFFANVASIALPILVVLGGLVVLYVIWAIFEGQGIDNCWHC